MTVIILTSLALLSLTIFSPGCQAKSSEQMECLRDIPLSMMNDLIKTTQAIQESLPRDHKRNRKLLPKFNLHCGKKLDVAVFKRILDIYTDHVFLKLWNSKEAHPRRFTDHLARLHEALRHCMERCQITLTNWGRKKTREMERTFKKLQPSDRFKALGEFETVLHWISVFMDTKKSQRRCHK